MSAAIAVLAALVVLNLGVAAVMFRIWRRAGKHLTEAMATHKAAGRILEDAQACLDRCDRLLPTADPVSLVGFKSGSMASAVDMRIVSVQMDGWGEQGVVTTMHLQDAESFDRQQGIR